MLGHAPHTMVGREQLRAALCRKGLRGAAAYTATLSAPAMPPSIQVSLQHTQSVREALGIASPVLVQVHVLGHRRG